MKVVSTCHKAGFDEYGHRWIESIKNWPIGTEFVMYGEGRSGVERELHALNIARSVRGWCPSRNDRSSIELSLRACEDLPRLVAFKEMHSNYVPPSWRFDIVKFSNKVFAAYDALYNHDGIGVWLDADAVTYSPIPSGYIESLLPNGCYLAHFKRLHYTETGFWVMDCRHPEHKAFMDFWVSLFESGGFQTLPEWHDCTTLDATIKVFRGRVKTHSLSDGHEAEMHPMALVELAKYIDHCKGPRKAQGFSAENIYR